MYINGEPIAMAAITSIHKKRRKDICGNYRYIAFTSILYTLCKKVVKKLIDDEYGPYDIEEQAGKSVVSALIISFQ